MGNRIDTQLALDALLMAVWRRRPSKTVLVHSDQGCQFTYKKHRHQNTRESGHQRITTLLN